MSKNADEKTPKIILGIESSCDETSAAVLIKDGGRVKILSNVVATSLSIQAKYGGVVPEQAAREQLKSIIPVITESLDQAKIKPANINAIAVTEGPGLIGSLLVGVETAKILSLVWQKPLVPVHHLLGHFYANWISSPVILGTNEVRTPESNSKDSGRASLARMTSEIASPSALRNDLPKFPAIGLLVSGGHTDLILMEGHGKYKYLGGTRDDAAGECFDKCARLLGLPYPGGPVISKLAEKGNPKAYNLPRPMISSKDFDFSFSGLKTAVANIVYSSEFIVHSKKKTSTNNELITNNLAASIEEAIIDVLIKKTIVASQKYHVGQILVAGGVAANQKLAKKIIATAQSTITRVEIFIPPPPLCTDNAAYIAACAFYNFHPSKDPLAFQANPNLSLEIE